VKLTIHRIFVEQAQALCRSQSGAQLVGETDWAKSELRGRLRASDGSELRAWVAAAPEGLVVAAGPIFAIFPATPDLEHTVAEGLDLFRALLAGRAGVIERCAGARWFHVALVRFTPTGPHPVATRWRIPWNVFAPRSIRTYTGAASGSRAPAG
jgi:hypothetical protein